jgi:ABC-2 type transport system permease protein
MLTILGGCYFAIMGSTILLKEEDEGSIAFLYSKPINRNQILTSKLLMGFTYIILFNLVVATTTFIGLTLSNDFDFIKWALISIAPFFLHLFSLPITLLVSMYYRKKKKHVDGNWNCNGNFMFNNRYDE